MFETVADAAQGEALGQAGSSGNGERKAECYAARGRRVPLFTIPSEPAPIYQRIFRGLRHQIESGAFQPGTQLPSSRLLAQELGVSRNSALLALEQLVAEGWAESAHRRGVFVTSVCRKAPHEAWDRRSAPGADECGVEMMSAGVDLLPSSLWQRHLRRVWRNYRPETLMGLDGDLGNYVLRSALARHVLASRGICVPPQSVAIVPSIAAAVITALRALLPPGSSIALESPGLISIARQVRAHGYRVVPACHDSAGLILSSICDMPARSAVLVSASQQRLSGSALTSNRRAQLLSWAEKNKSWIIELDEPAHAGRRGRLRLPMAAGSPTARLVYVRDIGSVLFPALRATALVTHREMTTFADVRLETFEALGHSDQLVLADLIETGAFAAHLRLRSAALLSRRSRLLNLIHHSFPSLRCSASTEFVTVRGSNQLLDRLVHACSQAALRTHSLAEFDLDDARSQGVVLPVAAFTSSVENVLAPIIK